MKYSVCYVGTLCVNDSTITVHDTSALGNLFDGKLLQGVIGGNCWLGIEYSLCF